MPQSDGLTEGQEFAGFTIVRRLGAGGMGQVYLAQHPRLPRRDALKVLPGELTENDEFRQRFNREADMASGLYHEHIVGIHDRGEFEGQLWISMDYVEGTDAARLLKSEYPSGMPRADVVEIITAVADALDHAHSRGLLHRDVKPANILLGDGKPRRRILLADFGIARELGDISGLTATNMLVGTTAYCAPEQLRGDDLDARADQYALGCTAFHLLTGSAPFEHSNPAVVITQHLSAQPPLASARHPELAGVDTAITKAMAKDPNARFATCSDFAAALADQVVTGPPDPSGPTSVFAGPTEVIAAPRIEAKPDTPKSNRTMVLIAAALVAVVLVAVGAVVGVRMLGGRHKQPSGGTAAPSVSASAPATASIVSPAPMALQLTTQITDASNVLGPLEHAEVERALTRLRNQRGTKLWVVYVNNFGGEKPFAWAEKTMRANGFADTDAILAIATDVSLYSFRVPGAITSGKAIDVEAIRLQRIHPAVMRHEWTRAAVAAANGLNVGAA
jgi:Protein kinase domain/TPM domain